jgi:hypothetical protein
MTSLLAEHFVNSVLPTSSGNMTGGVRSMNQASSPSRFFALLLVFLIIILIKSYIVYLGYNYIMPRIIFSLNQDKSSSPQEVMSKFRPITFTESIILTIFANTLLGA